MKKILNTFGILSVLLLVSFSCNMDDDLANPNEVAVNQADPDLILNAIELDFADFYSIASGNTVFSDKTTVGADRLMRMRAMNTGYRYQTAYQAQFLDDLWTLAYQKVLVNIETLVPLAESKGYSTHVAIAKALKAYTYITLVDLFGDVPRSKALQGFSDFNPAADAGESVYNYAITLLGEARAELAKTGTFKAPRDVYYSGSRANWTALVNTLEFKAWLNLSILPARKAEAETKMGQFIDLATGANKTGVNMIDRYEENFTYKYGTATVPVSRHPLYRQYYLSTEGAAGGYVCNSYLYELFNGKGVEDPRWRYYFYRQVGSIARANQVDPKSVGCSVGAIPQHYANGGYVFCTFEPGFYGRDHGDASGTPPDSPVLTCAGAYPAGGRIDDTPVSKTTYFGPTVQGDGGDGAGIEPMFMSFFLDYMRAELMARSGNDVKAKEWLTVAINASIDQVQRFSESIDQTLPGSLEIDRTPYINAVMDLYDDAAAKPRIVGRELWVACWGSAIEAYNGYRRTSGPDNMQPSLQVNEGPWLRSLVYPSVFVNLNGDASAVQKDFSKTNKVFWDANPDNLN
ncbi:SusD/RagB family nutrient-binding outer membrane lipoprotein [Chryseolinea lacunae]|uniref:SusD/RagB family nutrient-binding outer membrane lipoprotein n=1 Tax=Chryseolinea lacunae TaxID=2801331 RepID=A0ABS1KV61_9BACT|nr:SusD/RagB family nutrient-binding outer membrane lipoprotein [Chryseolinea lacunae]MBL0743358.1 SusD/RagB family nutrient-binding outer membrane lipoprotein [Chryseolinea lacunae]